MGRRFAIPVSLRDHRALGLHTDGTGGAYQGLPMRCAGEGSGPLFAEGTQPGITRLAVHLRPPVLPLFPGIEAEDGAVKL